MSLVERSKMPVDFDVDVVLNDVVQIVESVFGAMMSLETVPSETPWFPCGDRLTASIHLFAEDWKGTVLVECDRELACRFTGRFLSTTPPDTLDDRVRDVLGELANMIAGNLKCVLKPGARLSIPSIVDGGDYSIRMCGTDTPAKLAFRCADGLFWVAVLAVPIPC
jgi:chemotaxis protein CheX